MTPFLINETKLPDFDSIDPETIEDNVKGLLQNNREKISLLEKLEHADWKSFVEPLEQLDNSLTKTWNPIRHLNSVKASDALRTAYNNSLPLITEFYTELGQNQYLYDAYKSIRESKLYEEFSQPQKKTIEDSLRSFHLSGVDLEQQDKQQFMSLQKQLSEQQTQFENNVLDATQSWQLLLQNDQRLSGLPDYALEMLKQYAVEKNLSGYRVTLDMPCYIAIMTYADDRSLRQELYHAFVTRASDQSSTEKKWDNAEAMVKILNLRQQKARLLGFEDYVSLSLQTKMAESGDQVLQFLDNLTDKCKPAAEKEFEELQQFAQQQGFTEPLQAWDAAYYSEKQKQHQFEFSSQDLKPYFSEKNVIQGLFNIVETLFDVRIEEADQAVSRWVDDVRFFRILNQQGQDIAAFYFDLYARQNKQGGAWMASCMSRFKMDQELQLPVAFLTCNLTPPVGDKPALFTHEEVITLFHEFGHGIHHMLTEIDVLEVSGINGVEWDAVELPSQFMENYCWEKQALNLFARHYETNDPMPDELFIKMINAKNFQSAMKMVRQIEFALFDLLLHLEKNITDADQIQKIRDQVMEKVSVVPTPKYNRFQNSFKHIFAGGYAAGYYSYKWAEVLSADAFSAFEEEGIFNPQTGKRYLHCILGKGGSRPAAESFACFRGREPQLDALLKHNGIQ